MFNTVVLERFLSCSNMYVWLTLLMVNIVVECQSQALGDQSYSTSTSCAKLNIYLFSYSYIRCQDNYSKQS